MSRASSRAADSPSPDAIAVSLAEGLLSIAGSAESSPSCVIRVVFLCRQLTSVVLWLRSFALFGSIRRALNTEQGEEAGDGMGWFGAVFRKDANTQHNSSSNGSGEKRSSDNVTIEPVLEIHRTGLSSLLSTQSPAGKLNHTHKRAADDCNFSSSVPIGCARVNMGTELTILSRASLTLSCCSRACFIDLTAIVFAKLSAGRTTEPPGRCSVLYGHQPPAQLHNIIF